MIPHVLRSFYAYYLGQIETVIARLNQDLAVVLSQLQEDYKDIELVKKSEINLNVLSADVVVRNPEALGKRLFLTRDPREATLLGTSSGNSFVVVVVERGRERDRERQRETQRERTTTELLHPASSVCPSRAGNQPLSRHAN